MCIRDSLKVIPMDFISNPLTSVDDCSNLCVSIYNILPLKLSKFTTIAKKLPETITFRTLQNSTGSAAIHYDEYIHLAYARSLDKAWVFAALTDSNGNENLIKSWYVGTSKTKFDDACNQIWSLALSLSNKKYGKICLILTRLDGILPDDELMNWRRLSGRNIHLAVVCVDAVSYTHLDVYKRQIQIPLSSNFFLSTDIMYLERSPIPSFFVSFSNKIPFVSS